MTFTVSTSMSHGFQMVNGNHGVSEYRQMPLHLRIFSDSRRAAVSGITVSKSVWQRICSFCQKPDIGIELFFIFVIGFLKIRTAHTITILSFFPLSGISFA